MLQEIKVNEYFTAKIDLLKLLTSKSAITVILLLGIAISALSQTQIHTQNKNYQELIYVEADPFAFINKGYSFHLGYENWGWRFDLTKVKVDFPESFEEAFYNTKYFDLIANINGFKLDFLGNRSNWSKNAFIGLDVNHQRLSFEHRATGILKNLNTFNVGVRVGNKFSLYKGLYITPWVAVWRNLVDEEEFVVENDKVLTNDWDWIATFHLGYAIRL